MNDQILILTIAVTLAFALGIATGTSLERSRRQRRAVSREIDWMLTAQEPMCACITGCNAEAARAGGVRCRRDI